MRFAWVWGFLLLVFPLPYHLVVASLGGGNFAAGSAALSSRGSAREWPWPHDRGRVLGIGLRVDRRLRRADPHRQHVHRRAAAGVPAGACPDGHGRRRPVHVRRRAARHAQAGTRAEDRTACRQTVWSAIPMVVGVAVVLATMPLPTDTTVTAAITPTSPGPLTPGHPLVTPPTGQPRPARTSATSTASTARRPSSSARRWWPIPVAFGGTSSSAPDPGGRQPDQ